MNCHYSTHNDRAVCLFITSDGVKSPRRRQLRSENPSSVRQTAYKAIRSAQSTPKQINLRVALTKNAEVLISIYHFDDDKKWNLNIKRMKLRQHLKLCNYSWFFFVGFWNLIFLLNWCRCAQKLGIIFKVSRKMNDEDNKIWFFLPRLNFLRSTMIFLSRCCSEGKFVCLF